MKRISLLVLSLLTFESFALDCFEFETQDLPDGSPLNLDVKKEIWCYKPISHKNYKTLIFSYDLSGINRNLGMLVGKDDKILFLDQLLGKLRVIEQNNSSFTPYQIPISTGELKNAKRISLNLSEKENLEITKITNKLLYSKKYNISPSIERINDDLQDEEAYLPEALQPADGYWWPFRDVPMAKPSDSPTRIYDLYVKTKTGKNPGATDWELSHHDLQTVWWGGHCNGWVASSILYGFYEKSLILETGNQSIIINPLQIQGMRTETSWCNKLAFYGKRYRTLGDDPREPSPDLFHKTIRYYLKELGKPIAVDRIYNEVVDNSIYSGYKITVEKEETNRYFVTAKLRTHYYNYNPVFTKKVAFTKELKYQYYLNTDNNGVITGGEWKGDSPNPDFLWVPLAPSNCGKENPNMDYLKVDEMIETLPKESN